MAGIVFRSPGVFAGADDLPRIAPARPVPAPGAVADWAADQLPLGPVGVWSSMVGTHALAAPVVPSNSQRPLVIGEGADRYVSFDGENDRLDTAMSVLSPFTVVLVARLPQVGPNQRIMSGGTNDAGVTIGPDSAMVNWIASNGTFRIFEATPDADWHVFIMAFDGPNSFFMLDDWEGQPADPGSNGMQWISLGYS